MKFGEDTAVSKPVRLSKPRTWLQFYVDFFMANGPDACSGLSVVVASDPGRRNGCNWHVVAYANEEGKDTLGCVRYLEDNLRFMFVLYDLE